MRSSSQSSAQPSAASIALTSLADTEQLATYTAHHIEPKTIVSLTGALGTGKTTFVRALLNALARRYGVAPPDAVPSPSFTLVQTYDLGTLQVLHADLWRITDPRELPALALNEAQTQGAALFIEWPEHGAENLATADLQIVLSFAEDGTEDNTEGKVEDNTEDNTEGRAEDNTENNFDSVQDFSQQDELRVACLSGKLAETIVAQFNQQK